MNITIRKATASERFPGSFIVTVDGKLHEALGWGEMLEVIVAATRGFERIPYAADEAPIAVVAPKAELERIDHGLSDILCWSLGYQAATPDNPERHPFGIEAVRSIRDLVITALQRANGDRT